MSHTDTDTTDRLVYISRRAYETGNVQLALRTADTWDEHDTGWELLLGTETGLELVDPGNGLLISVAKAIAFDAALAPLLLPDTPPKAAAYRKQASTDSFVPTEIPDAYWEELGLSW